MVHAGYAMLLLLSCMVILFFRSRGGRKRRIADGPSQALPPVTFSSAIRVLSEPAAAVPVSPPALMPKELAAVDHLTSSLQLVSIPALLPKPQLAYIAPLADALQLAAMPSSKAPLLPAAEESASLVG